MSVYVFTPQAEDDLFAIWSYIAQDSVESAERVEAHVYEACTFLASKPKAGHVRTDLTARPVRFWTLPRFRKYVIVYDPGSEPLRIIRIFHGAMNLPVHLEPYEPR